MAAITLKDIVKRYGDGYLAVNDVSLDIADGEFVILVGPSGCGKSTLLRMIVGLEDITSGDMLIGGKRVNDKAPRDRHLAMVFQNYALYPHLTVYENIAFPLRLQQGPVHGRARSARRSSSPRTPWSCRTTCSASPRTCPAGSASAWRWAARSCARRSAFLFDEPLSNLDAKLRGQMRTEIARMQRRLGTTTVYVTHDQTEAMTLGDRVAVLRKGELQQVASPRGLYEQPVNLFVAGFIGSPPMNFMPGEVEGDVLKLPGGGRATDGRPALADRLREVVIVGLRPEHFCGRRLAGGRQAQVRRGVRDRGRRHRVARLRPVRLRAVRDQPQVSATARGARPRPRRRGPAHPARRRARLRVADPRRRRRDAVVRPGQAHGVRPGVRREPHVRRRRGHARSTSRTRPTARRRSNARSGARTAPPASPPDAGQQLSPTGERVSPRARPHEAGWRPRATR